jgi:pyrroloquinoline quinone biosynthesis protein B
VASLILIKFIRKILIQANLFLTMRLLLLASFLVLHSFSNDTVEKNSSAKEKTPYIQILGIAQDAGHPQIGCQKSCCSPLWESKQKGELISCLAVVDPETNDYWVFDATPDFKDQLAYLHTNSQAPFALPTGIFLSHAHIGHYTGLMDLGFEAMNAQNVPVFAMPRMGKYLRQNGPWSQLVSKHNISLNRLSEDSLIQVY